MRETTDARGLAPGGEPASGWRPVRITGLPVGLMLRTDEYLTNLSQELGMLRLDRRPEAGAPGRLRSVETVDDLLTAFAEIRNDVRIQAETAFDAGRDTFEVEVELPPEAALAALAMIEALTEILGLAAEGRILLPPLEEEAAQFFFAFLAECARQVEQGAADPEPLGPVPESAAEPAELEGRKVERQAEAPTVLHEEQRETRRFTRELESATGARRFVVQTLRSWSLDDAAGRAELPAAELVSNALLHSVHGIEVAVKRGSSCVLVEVHDSSGAPPEVRRRGNEADSGRGLLLIDALVDRWGWDDRSDLGKRVWFELDLR